jgi:hypothetical protein
VIWALVRNVGTRRPGDLVEFVRLGEGEVQVAETTRAGVPRPDTGADCLVVAMMPGNAGGAKGMGHLGLVGGQPECPGGVR